VFNSLAQRSINEDFRMMHVTLARITTQLKGEETIISAAPVATQTRQPTEWYCYTKVLHGTSAEQKALLIPIPIPIPTIPIHTYFLLASIQASIQASTLWNELCKSA
jgi:hypothetical protein